MVHTIHPTINKWRRSNGLARCCIQPKTVLQLRGGRGAKGRRGEGSGGEGSGSNLAFKVPLVWLSSTATNSLGGHGPCGV